MRKIRYLFLGIGFLLLPIIVMAAEREPLPLAEEGSPEAEKLQEAHEADLETAKEDPAEAERRTKRLRETEGSSVQPVTPPPQPSTYMSPSPSETEPGPAIEGEESDLQLESPEAASKRDVRIRRQAEKPTYEPSAEARRPSKAGEVESDLAVGMGEPVWLREGGNYRYPPAYRRKTIGATPSIRIIKPTELHYIETPPFTFNAWSTDLTERNRHILDQIATVMKEQPDEVPKLVIEAYTDSSGDAAVNQALTIARAHVVKAYLIMKGVGVHRLEAKGLGSENPIASNETKAGRAQNRRVEFKIVK